MPGAVRVASVVAGPGRRSSWGTAADPARISVCSVPPSCFLRVRDLLACGRQSARVPGVLPGTEPPMNADAGSTGGASRPTRWRLGALHPRASAGICGAFPDLLPEADAGAGERRAEPCAPAGVAGRAEGAGAAAAGAAGGTRTKPQPPWCGGARGWRRAGAGGRVGPGRDGEGQRARGDGRGRCARTSCSVGRRWRWRSDGGRALSLVAARLDLGPLFAAQARQRGRGQGGCPAAACAWATTRWWGGARAGVGVPAAALHLHDVREPGGVGRRLGRLGASAHGGRCGQRGAGAVAGGVAGSS